MSGRALVLAVLALAGCRGPVAQGALAGGERAAPTTAPTSHRSALANVPPPEPPPSREPHPGQDETPLQHEMQDHFEAIHQIELALLFGHLDQARALAGELARAATPVELRRVEAAFERVRTSARELAAAADVAAALPLVTRMAGECASCHQETGAVTSFPWQREPDDDGGTAQRMARHQWAADRIWQGLVGPSELEWDEGLRVLGAAPLPAAKLSPDRARHAELDRLAALLARQARAAARAEPARRSEAFAQMLDTCTRCHGLVAR